MLALPVSPDLTAEERAEAERLDERPAGDLSEPELTLVERLIGERQRADFAGHGDWEQSARFGPWRARGRGMMRGVVIADFRADVAARFAIDTGEQPKLSLEGLRGGT